MTPHMKLEPHPVGGARINIQSILEHDKICGTVIRRDHISHIVWSVCDNDGQELGAIKEAEASEHHTNRFVALGIYNDALGAYPDLDTAARAILCEKTV